MEDDFADRVADELNRSAARDALKRFAHRYPCATPAQYKAWIDTVRAAKHISGAEAEPDVPREARASMLPSCWFCTDCTPDYQAKMIKEERCLHPEIQFRTDKDKFMEGYVPSKYLNAKNNKQED